VASIVHASFLATVRRVDPQKKAALARMLAERVIATGSGEKLDEKLAAATFTERKELPPDCEPTFSAANTSLTRFA
jgi:hypothetical protein